MIKDYLLARRLPICTYMTTALMVVLAAVAANIPLQTPLYGLFLSALLLLALAMADFVRFRGRYNTLKAMVDTAADSQLPQLPPPRDALDEAYQSLFIQLHTCLWQRNEESERAQREIVDYYTLWLHQVKTPIAALRLMMQSGNVPPLALSRELSSIERYVGMALENARLGSSENDLVIKKTAVAPLVRQSVKKFADSFIEKHLSLHLDELTLCVHTDEKWLCFILEQLISNAVKYTSSGSVSIYEKDGTLFVRDTGIGIMPDDLPRVFDYGYTGYNGRIDKRASGVGLSMAHRAAKLIGVKLSLTSVLGEGSCAAITFPKDAPIVRDR